MWARWFRVKQTVWPEYTNTSGDFSTGAMVVLHQMLPRGPTSTHRHNRVGIKIYSMLKIIITFSPSLLLQLLIHKHIRMHTQTHSNTAHTDMHKHIRADLNLPSVCVRTPWLCGVYRYSKTRKAGGRASRLCVCTHTCPVYQEKWPPRSPWDTRRDTAAWLRTWCEYYQAWPDWLQLAANRQGGGGGQ